MRYLLAEFGRATLGEITPTDVRSWHGKLNRSALHANTVSKIYRLMRSIMTTAVDDGRIPSNPVHIRGASKEDMIALPRE
jgi:site-specific recombinase XerC